MSDDELNIILIFLCINSNNFKVSSLFTEQVAM